jgi:prepilin-type processing-associated H-X9-DG protein
MKTRRGMTLIEGIVVIAIFFFLFCILRPPRPHPLIVERVKCMKNLQELGAAMASYANNYDGYFPQLPGNGPWSKELGFDYFLDKPNFNPNAAGANTARTISASWYLLIKYGDLQPKSFTCPAQNNITEFDGLNPQNRDMKSLWDFGPDPYKHVSYSMHNPYGKFPAHKNRSAAFAVAADMSPYFNNGELIQITNEHQYYDIDGVKPYSHQLHNSPNHNYNQNILYIDGHVENHPYPDTGVKQDNIYTYWSENTNNDPNELYRRVGQPPTGRGPENDAKSKDDSFLAI